jgi:hypothetical protein
MKEILLEYKEDLWRVPADAQIITLKYQISMHGAHELVKRCRELHRLVIDGHAYSLIEPAVKEYLQENFHVAIQGDVISHDVPDYLQKQIRELYDMGHKSMEQLAIDFRIPYELVKHIIERK